MTSRPRGAVVPVVLSLIAGVAVVLGGVGPAGAAACTFDQVNHGDAIVVRTATNGDGSMVAFSSTDDLTGENADENLELFLWDAAPADPSDEFDQLTVTTGSANQPFLSMSDSGNRMAVLSPRNLDPPNNADLNVEVFLYDRTLDTFLQLTTTTGANINNAAVISGDGNRVAFISRANLTGGNADGNGEVFVRTLQPNSTVQVTNSSGSDNAGVAADGDGDRVAYVGTHDPVGQNPSGFQQVFVRDLTAGTTTQVTHHPVNFTARSPDLSANGAFVTHATSQPLVGTNSDLNLEFYRTRLSDGATVRLTDGTGDTGLGIVTAAGDRLAYQSDHSIAEGSMPSYNLNVSDVGGNRSTVVDAGLSLASVEGLDMSRDGTRLSFQTNLDLVAENGTHRQALYVATCGPAAPLFSDVPRSNPFYDQIQWLSEAEIANGFPNGTFDPLGSVKRQQMANFLFNLEGNPLYTPPTVPDFSDVPTSNAFYQAIEWLYEFGIADGFPNGTFRPLDPVKRQQMANFLYNLAGEPAFTPPDDPTFSDVPTSNPFFLEIEWLAAQGIAAGFPNGTFLPQDPVKRQQMANFVYRFTRTIHVES